jgi:hypothetical protein
MAMKDILFDRFTNQKKGQGLHEKDVFHNRYFTGGIMRQWLRGFWSG